MGNPWADIEKLRRKFDTDRARVEEAVRAASATRLKVLDTGIWKCRFRPYKAEPQDVRGRSADELVTKLNALTKERATAKAAAAEAREKARREHREAVKSCRASLKELGASRFKVRSVGHGTYRWTCKLRERSRTPRFDVELDQPSADQLVAEVKAFISRARKGAP